MMSLVAEAERHMHDYKRHGTTSLFAALDADSGKVIGKCYRRHRAKEFKNFLVEIEATVPEGIEVHFVMDNYAAHKTPAISNHPRHPPKPPLLGTDYATWWHGKAP